jgi:integrase/recombinase XerD
MWGRGAVFVMADSDLYKQILGKLSLQQAIDEYLLAKETEGLTTRTIKYYKDELARFTQYIGGDTPVEEIAPDQIRRALQEIAKTRSKGGLHAAWRPLRALFYWYEAEFEPENWKNPVRKVKISAPRPAALPGVSMDDYEKLVAVCKGGRTGIRDRALFLCLLDTCARAEEFISLNIKDVNLINGSVLIREGKGNKPRYVNIGSKARKALRNYLKTRENLKADQPLFTMTTGVRFSYNSLVSLFRWRSGQAGIDRPGLHDIRRAGALELLRNGADISEISKYLGHESIDVTMRYLAITPDDLQNMHRRASPVDNGSF